MQSGPSGGRGQVQMSIIELRLFRSQECGKEGTRRVVLRCSVAAEMKLAADIKLASSRACASGQNGSDDGGIRTYGQRHAHHSRPAAALHICDRKFKRPRGETLDMDWWLVALFFSGLLRRANPKRRSSARTPRRCASPVVAQLSRLASAQCQRGFFFRG